MNDNNESNIVVVKSKTLSNLLLESDKNQKVLIIDDDTPFRTPFPKSFALNSRHIGISIISPTLSCQNTIPDWFWYPRLETLFPDIDYTFILKTSYPPSSLSSLPPDDNIRKRSEDPEAIRD